MQLKIPFQDPNHVHHLETGSALRLSSRGVSNSIKCNSSRITFVLETAVSLVQWMLLFFFFTFCCVGPIKNAIVKSDVSIHNCVSVNRSSPPIVLLLSHIKCIKSYQESGHPRESGQEKNSFEYIFGCQKIWTRSFTPNRRIIILTANNKLRFEMSYILIRFPF